MSGGDDFKFIIDEPASEDFFDTHSPVAAAIAQSIIRNPALKIIGLLGRWGSGKSTIVREVEERLHNADQSYLTFKYDAWLHQNDPLRRSFMESLVAFFVDKELIEKDKWDKELKRLSGSLEEVDHYETPIITSEAKLFFFLAIFMAFGASLLDRETFQDSLGPASTQVGQWTLVVAILLIVLPITIWFIRYFIHLCDGHKTTFFPSIIFNKTLDHKNTVTYKPIEPTSIEFGHSFRSLMKDIHKNDTRIVIVIDNIDRIVEKEAMQIWANARSFFLSANDDNDLQTEIYHPIVILPIDAKSIPHLFSSGESERGQDNLARSFINKTFDVTFDVPAPVMSDWKRYLSHKMEYCLGQEYSEQRYFRTRQFLEAWFSLTDTPITPREINKTLNRLVALLIQWKGTSIPFETIAYFSINRERIADEVEKEVSREDHPLARISADWAREVAALNFGVGVDLAAQVLITEPIKLAILENDPDYVEPYRKVTGYGDILEQVTANLPTDEQHPSPDLTIIGNAIHILAMESGNEVSHAAAWKNLLNGFMELEGGPPQIRFADSILLLSDHVEKAEASDFFRTIERVGDSILSADDASAEAVADVGLVGAKALELASQFDAPPPVFDVSGNAEKYVQRLVWMQASPVAVQRVRTGAPHDHVINELTRRLTDEQTTSTVPSLVRLLTSESAKLMLRRPFQTIDVLIAAAEQAARDHGGNTEIFRSAIATLDAAAAFDEQTRAAIQRLVEDGTLVNKLKEAVGTRDAIVIVIIISALVWREVEIRSPIGSSWEAFLRELPDIPRYINGLLDTLFNTEHPLKKLRKNYDASFSMRELITALVEDRVNRSKLGRLASAEIIQDIYGYSRMMRPSLRNEFARQLTTYEKFWPNIKSMPWSENISEVAALLSKRGGDTATRIRAELIDRVNNTTEEEWLAAIQQALEPFHIVTKFIDPSEMKLGVGSTLMSALISSASTVAAASKAIRSRWFMLAEIISAPARRKAMEAMGEVTFGLAAPAKLSLLKAGGLRFLHEGGFVRRVDDSIKSIVIPLARSNKGRLWLSDRSTEIRKLTDAASIERKDDLKKLINRLVKSNDPDQSHWAGIVQKAWGLDRRK